MRHAKKDRFGIFEKLTRNVLTQTPVRSGASRDEGATDRNQERGNRGNQTITNGEDREGLQRKPELPCRSGTYQ